MTSTPSLLRAQGEVNASPVLAATLKPRPSIEEMVDEERLLWKPLEPDLAIYESQIETASQYMASDEDPWSGDFPLGGALVLEDYLGIDAAGSSLPVDDEDRVVDGNNDNDDSRTTVTSTTRSYEHGVTYPGYAESTITGISLGEFMVE